MRGHNPYPDSWLCSRSPCGGTVDKPAQLKGRFGMTPNQSTMSLHRSQAETMIPITPGLDYTWVTNQVLVYEVTSLSVPLMVEWSKHILENLASWPAERPLQVLYHFSDAEVSRLYLVMTKRDIFNIGVTVVGKLRVEQMLQRADLFGRLALLIPESVSGEIVTTRAKSHPVIESRLFTDYNVAMAWLTDMSAIRENFHPTVLMPQVALTPAEVAKDDATQGQRQLGLLYQHLRLLVPLTLNRSVVIGRQHFSVATVGEACYTVSRIHARLEVVQGLIYITDLNSTNGTRLQGQPLKPYERTPVQVSEKIHLGALVLTLGFG